VADLVRIRNRLSIERQRFIRCRNDGVLATNLRGPRNLSSGQQFLVAVKIGGPHVG